MKNIKKTVSFLLSGVILLFCGCAKGEKISKSTEFYFDTVVTLEAECDAKILNKAFSLCEKYENMLSKTKKGSEVYKLNHTNGFVTVSYDTRYLIEKAVEYARISDGAFDITICPVSDLWDFEGTALPDRNEIAEALKNVDYESIEINGNDVNLNGKQIDLGGIAKGYIADKLLEFFKKNGVKSGIINLGGNVYVFGDSDKTVGITKPFSDSELSGKIKLNNLSVVTSGTYRRYIEKDGKIYHHILDKKTGYGVESDLDSATIIGASSLDCDCLATVCILKGESEAKSLIEIIPDVEGIFISKSGNITHTSGIKKQKDTFLLK